MLCQSQHYCKGKLKKFVFTCVGAEKLLVWPVCVAIDEFTHSVCFSLQIGILEKDIFT